MRLKAIGNKILCINGDFGDLTTDAGLIIKSTIGTSEGITPRWFQVFEVGPEIDWLKSGQWVYVAYGRWTEAIVLEDERFDTEDNRTKVWSVEPEGCLAVSDEKPEEVFNFNTETVHAQKKVY